MNPEHGKNWMKINSINDITVQQLLMLKQSMKVPLIPPNLNDNNKNNTDYADEIVVPKEYEIH